MVIDEKISTRFYMLYFLAACVVVSIHCGVEMKCYGVCQSWYMRYATKWAVPFFFLMSGAFAKAGYKNTFAGFCAYGKKKVRSLVLPYILWCLIGIIMRMPLVSDCLISNTVFNNVNAIFGFTSGFPIGNKVLWFLRTLIILQGILMVSLGCVARDKKLRFLCWGVLFLAGVSLGFVHSGWFVELFVNPSAPIYFIGGYIVSDLLLVRHSLLFSKVIFVGGTATLAFIIMADIGESVLSRHCSNVAIIGSLIGLIDVLIEKQIISGCSLCKNSFFVYCFHRVPVEYAGKFVERIGALNSDAVYLFFCCLAVLFSLLVASICHRYVPNVYVVLNGARK